MQVAGEAIVPDAHVTAILRGFELGLFEPAVLHQPSPVRHVQVNFNQRYKGLVVPIAWILIAEGYRQLGAVIQQRVKVPPLDVRFGGVETDTVFPWFDMAFGNLEACIIFGGRPGGLVRYEWS